MKANAPERIWIDPATDLSKLSGHVDNDSVEYIRKDAFIDKVCMYLNEHREGVIEDDYIKNFRKYMEE